MLLVFGLLGLCMGSFINALVWRLHQRSKKGAKRYSVTLGRSVCPHCKHVLAVKDLIPVLSWLELRGRCRYCRANISWQYPAVELITAGLFVVSYHLWPYDFSVIGWVAFLAWLSSLVLLVALLVYDLRWMLLPNKLVYPLVGTSLVVAACVPLLHDVALGGTLLGVFVISGLFWVLFQISDGKWIGGGDVKLAVALGLLAGGFIESLLVLFIASLLGSVVGLPLLLQGNKTSHKVPFGPFLISAVVIVFFWSQHIIDWYLGFIGV